MRCVVAVVNFCFGSWDFFILCLIFSVHISGVLLLRTNYQTQGAPKVVSSFWNITHPLRYIFSRHLWNTTSGASKAFSFFLTISKNWAYATRTKPPSRSYIILPNASTPFRYATKDATPFDRCKRLWHSFMDRYRKDSIAISDCIAHWIHVMCRLARDFNWCGLYEPRYSLASLRKTAISLLSISCTTQRSDNVSFTFLTTWPPSRLSAIFSDFIR